MNRSFNQITEIHRRIAFVLNQTGEVLPQKDLLSSNDRPPLNSSKQQQKRVDNSLLFSVVEIYDRFGVEKNREIYDIINELEKEKTENVLMAIEVFPSLIDAFSLTCSYRCRHLLKTHFPCISFAFLSCTFYLCFFRHRKCKTISEVFTTFFPFPSFFINEISETKSNSTQQLLSKLSIHFEL
jgi:AAA+ ATPase superfamily predicted ATPase